VQCPLGGHLVAAGLDLDGNGVLQPSEVSSSGYVCNGASGSDGSNAISSLMNIEAEPAGAHCSFGGSKVTSGPDTNGNGALDTAEVTSTAFVCSGATGATGNDGLNTLIATANEPAGANCATGGTKITAGLDVNANNLLDAGEVSATSYACNGAPGPAGTPGTSPDFGGTQFEPVQFLPGVALVVLTCETTAVSGGTSACNGPRINGLQIEAEGDVIHQSDTVEQICSSIGATRITSWSRSSSPAIARPYMSWNGSSWTGGSDASFTNSFSRIACTP